MKSMFLLATFYVCLLQTLPTSLSLTLPSVTLKTSFLPKAANGQLTAHLNTPFTFHCVGKSFEQILNVRNVSIAYQFFYHPSPQVAPLEIGFVGADYLKRLPWYSETTFANGSLKVELNNGAQNYPNWTSLTITPLAFNATTFSCKLIIYDYEQPKTTTVSIYPTPDRALTVKVLPQAVLTTNVTYVEKNKPFTATCKVALPGSSSLKVNFYKGSEGLIASYEMDNARPNDTILTIVDQYEKPNSLASVSAGHDHAYPTFDLVISQADDRYDLYWCEVVGEGVKVLTFDLKEDPADRSETTASCEVHNFDPAKAGRPFTVVFREFYHIFPQEYLVATFSVNPAAHLTTIHYRRDRLILGPVATTGSNPSFPRFFAIKKVTTSGPSSTSWYCELQYFPVGEEGEEGVNKSAEPNLLLLLGTAVPKSDQEDSKAALAAELLTKLKSSQVKVMAAGHVSGQLALFISGSGSKTDFSGGYQVTVGSDPGDGRFDVDSVEKLAGKYSGFGKATDSMFLCSDSDSSSSLIAMDSLSVGAFNLAENKFTPLPIVPGAMSACYQSGEIFFASNKPKHYFQLKSSGNVTLSEFVSATIASAQICTPLTTLGQLCATGKGGDAKITISSSCSGSPPSDITAGYVGDSKAYLFDGSNAVYYFDASVFKQGGGQQSAWFTLASISTPDPNKLKTTTEGGGGASAATTIVIIVFVVVLFLCIAAGVTVYCKYGKKEDSGDKGKKEKKEKDSKSGSQKSGQKSSSSVGKNKKKNTPSAKGSGGGRPQPTKSTVKSKPSGAGSSVSNQEGEEEGVSSSSAEGGSSKAKTKTAAGLKGKRSSVSNRGKMGGGGGSSSSSRGLKKLPGGKLLLKKKNKMGKNKMRSGKAKKSLGGKTAKKVSSEKNRSQSKKTSGAGGRSQSRRGGSSKGRGPPPGLQAADLKDMKSLANLGLESTSAAAAAEQAEE
ncbi:hypothetical protein TYRP_021254 [Tyrophagus putrescentiae]|nr:hypothetical protein TYRP_021254 [Tyrophagus putrescentiae]